MRGRRSQWGIRPSGITLTSGIGSSYFVRRVICDAVARYALAMVMAMAVVPADRARFALSAVKGRWDREGHWAGTEDRVR